MSESVIGRVAGRIAAICALALPVVLVPFMLLQPGSAQAGRTGTISSVEVEQTPQGTTRVILLGAQDAMYTAFLRESPRRLIIDLPEVDFEGVDSPIAVGPGLVSDVTLGAFGDARISPTTARVSIGLATEVEYELEPQADRLIVTLKPVAVARVSLPIESPEPAPRSEQIPALEPTGVEVASTAGETLPGHEPAAPEANEPAEAVSPPAGAADPSEGAEGAAESVELSDAPAAPASPSASEASPEVPPAVGPRIVGVSEQGSSVAIESDSALEQVDSFVLESPDRIVIDFAGATSAVWPSTRAFEQGPVKQIRVGEHADKVRVVLDLRAPSEAHTLVPLDHGMRVDIQSATLLALPEPLVADAESLPASPAEPPPAELAEPQSVESEAMDAAPEVQLRDDDPADQSTPEIRLRDDPEQAALAESEVPAEQRAPAPSEIREETPTPVEGTSTDASPFPSQGEVEVEVSEEGAAPAESEVSEESAAPAQSEVSEESAAPAQSAVSHEAAAPSQGVAVQSIQFESLPELDRVVLTLSAHTDAELIQPDPSTVIVDLPGVAIDPAHERRVDTRDFGGPVEVFSAFHSPEIAGPNVRVVVKRTGEEQPRLTWQGTQLRIEFRHSPTTAGVPPVPSPIETAAPPSASPPVAEVPAAQVEGVGDSVPGGVLEDADEFGGPELPAAIDLLEEGGFSRAKDYQGRHISLDFEDAEIGNILRMIAEVSNLNVIAGEEVKGKVTIRMVDVPWDQALDVVLLTKGLGFLRIGNILRIAPVDVLHREEEARLQERRAKEKLEDLVVKLQPVNYANVTEIKDLVSHLLSPRGTVNVDSRTSTLIIKDIPTVIQEATALVKAIDTATPQVLIEAKIVEASLDFSRALGARWGTQFNANGSDGGARDLRLSDGTNNVVPGFGTGKQATSFVVANPIAAAVGTLTLGLLSFADHLQLDLAIQAAESKKKGKVVSSPRVVTLDNREATIQQGVAIAFTASTADSVNTTFVDAVLELKVKPHITADKSIIMKIKVSRNAPDLSASTGSVQGITKNETETEALVRDGQTLVLGGIYTVDKSHTRSRMPFLADVPVLGVAFRSTERKDIRKELLVFVTPRIVRGVTGGN